MPKSRMKGRPCPDPTSQTGMPSYCGSGHVLEAGQDYCGDLDCCYNVWGTVTRAKKALAPYHEAKDSYCQVDTLHQPHNCEECMRVEMGRLEEGEEWESLPREQWLPPVPPEETTLSCICWHVDWDGFLTVSTQRQQKVLSLISSVLASKYSGSLPGKEDCQFEVGDCCIAVFHLDGSWCRGSVRSVRREEGLQQVLVHFVDYGSVSWCAEDKVRRKLFMLETPVQSLTVRLAGLAPLGQGGWQKDTLDLLHSTLVEQQLRLEVKKATDSLPLVARVWFASIDVNRMLLSNGFARLEEEEKDLGQED